MIATTERPSEDPPTAHGNPRIVGIDLARALAMAGMLFVHYVWPDGSRGPLDLLAIAMSGRAMPLFMMLGGVGVVLSTKRSRHPDRTLLIRGAILFGLGLAVHAGSEWIAVVLQSYGLLFVVSPLLRRVPTGLLVPLSLIVMALGAWSYQVFGGTIRRSTSIGDFTEPVSLIRSLVVDGFYPFLPVASFFIAGMAIGRLDLRSPRVAGRLAIGGLVLGGGAVAVAYALRLGFDVAESTEVFAEGGFGLDRFSWERLLIKEGHSQMPTWVLSATGTSMFVIGVSLLAAPYLGAAGKPFVSLGRLALTFYVFQVLLTKVVTPPTETSFTAELITVGLIYFGFMVFAVLWTRWIRFGPLEALLRVESIVGALWSRRFGQA